MGNTLPTGWTKINLKESVDFRKGKKPKILSEKYFEQSVPYRDIKGLEKDIVSFYADSESAKYFKDNDVVIVWDGSRSGLILKSKPGAIGSTLGALSPCGYKSEYLYYFLLSQYEVINSKARGVGIPHVDPTYLWSLHLPLPPLAEQERIVAKLNKLFTQHEKIKNALNRIPRLLKTFRNQALTQAVTGKLTEQWRKGKRLEEWKEWLVKDISTKLGSGSTPRGGNTTYLSEGIPLVRSMNVVFGGIKNDGLAFINEAQATALKNAEIHAEDILLNITGASIGRLCLADQTVVGGRVNQHVFIIRSNREIVYPKFLEYYLRSNVVQNFIEEIKYGAGMEAISKAQIGNLKINIPTLSEQQEIVCRVKSLFAKADDIEARFQSIKEKIDDLPQSILHKAFEGELVPQLPTDGDAKDLLEEILTLKQEIKGKRGRQ